MVILGVRSCPLMRDRCDSSQHKQLHKRAGHHRIYSQNLFGEQSEVGTSSFQHLSFIAAAWEMSWATLTSNKIKHVLSFPKLQGRQHELQYNTSGQIWKHACKLYWVPEVYGKTERLEWIPFQKLSFSFSRSEGLVCSQWPEVTLEGKVY